MKPQSGAFLEKAEDLLGRAEAMLLYRTYRRRGPTAYLAGFHAAQALIFEGHGRVFKTHSSVQSEFGRLVMDETDQGQELRAFLGRAYNLKAIADYETGSDAKISEA